MQHCNTMRFAPLKHKRLCLQWQLDVDFAQHESLFLQILLSPRAMCLRRQLDVNTSEHESLCLHVVAS